MLNAVWTDMHCPLQNKMLLMSVEALKQIRSFVHSRGANKRGEREEFVLVGYLTTLIQLQRLCGMK